MKLVTFLAEGKELVGVRSEDGRYYYPISALGLNYRDMNELVDCITDTERGRLAAGVANGSAWVKITWTTRRNPFVTRTRPLMGSARMQPILASV